MREIWVAAIARQRALAGRMGVVQKSGGNGEPDVAGQIEAALSGLGIALPTPAAPVANYAPFVISGNLVTISGQLPLGPDGKIAKIYPKVKVKGHVDQVLQDLKGLK